MRLLSPAVTATALMFLSLGGPVFAQDAAPKMRQACMSSARDLCATEIGARDRQAVKMCLWKNLDKVAPECRDAIQAARAAHQGAAAKSPD
ncbi:MAG TPA: hypothetical protein VGI79_03155 [Caulobacteraceae bacterium]|jgi:hypothetical protein